MLVKTYSEDLDLLLAKVHDACEGRYDLDGYELNVIHAALIQLKEEYEIGYSEGFDFAWKQASENYNKIKYTNG